MKIISQQYQIILVKNIFMQQKNIIHVHKKSTFLYAAGRTHPSLLPQTASLQSTSLQLNQSKQTPGKS